MTDLLAECQKYRGALLLGLPKASSAQLKIESFSGDISSAIGKVVKEEYGLGQSLNDRLGEGNGRIELNTMSGDITIELK